jgi:hypothetical protein
MIVEVSQFRLVPGTDEQAFLDASEGTQSVGHEELVTRTRINGPRGG